MAIGKVVHCKKDAFDVYIGRPTKWGNPYAHQEGTSAQFKVKSREEAIDLYRRWIEFRLYTADVTPADHPDRMLKDEVMALRGKVLGCWCSPKPCHGDVLLEIANSLVSGCPYGCCSNDNANAPCPHCDRAELDG